MSRIARFMTQTMLQLAQPQKMARGLKFHMQEVEGLFYLCSENKGTDQLCSYRRADLCLFVWVEALRPSQQFFSHVGMEPPLPGHYQYFSGGKCLLLKDTTRRPE